MMAKMKWLAAASVILVAAALGLTDWFHRMTFPRPARVEVIIKTNTMEFWQVLVDGVHVAAEEFKAEVRVNGPRTEADVDGQIAMVEDAIRRKPDAIVLAATDFDRLVPVAQNVIDNGIRLIIVDSGINADIAHSVVQTDNVAAGNKAGRVMQEHLQGPTKVAIISFVKNAASLLDREKGVREVLEGDPRIVRLDTYYVDGSEQNAYSKVMEILRKDPDVTGVIGLNEGTTVGAGKAIRELGLKDRVTLVGFDNSLEEIKFLEEGVLKATVIQRPFSMGYLSIKTAVEAISGKKVPKTIDTGSLVITRQNMYEEENQKLLFPFVRS
ncbi:MAG TPA: substrate-binding domain-containing protein [Paenibacillaceae bacterium]